MCRHLVLCALRCPSRCSAHAACTRPSFHVALSSPRAADFRRSPSMTDPQQRPASPGRVAFGSSMPAPPSQPRSKGTGPSARPTATYLRPPSATAAASGFVLGQASNGAPNAVGSYATNHLRRAASPAPTRSATSGAHRAHSPGPTGTQRSASASAQRPLSTGRCECPRGASCGLLPCSHTSLQWCMYIIESRGCHHIS